MGVAVFGGAVLDVFILDERSYRGPNSPNRQPTLNDEAAFLGAGQLAWLKRSLLDSTATWKLIASDMPISLVVPDLNPDVPKGMSRRGQTRITGPPPAASSKSPALPHQEQ
jgi:alkaline phosphatase D